MSLHVSLMQGTEPVFNFLFQIRKSENECCVHQREQNNNSLSIQMTEAPSGPSSALPISVKLCLSQKTSGHVLVLFWNKALIEYFAISIHVQRFEQWAMEGIRKMTKG